MAGLLVFRTFTEEMLHARAEGGLMPLVALPVALDLSPPPGAVEIVIGPVGLEIDVTLDVVC